MFTVGHNGIGGTLSSSNLTSLGGCSPVPTPPSAHIGVNYTLVLKLIELLMLNNKIWTKLTLVPYFYGNN